MLCTLPAVQDEIVEATDSLLAATGENAQKDLLLSNCVTQEVGTTSLSAETASMLKIAFIGAGGVNFGGLDPGAPWDHASRLEELSNTIPLEIVGIHDLNQERLDFVLNDRKAKKLALWTNTKAFTDVKTMLDTTKPDAVFIGIPPFAHGLIEELCAERGIDMFIEKPISCKDTGFVENLRECFASHPDLIVSVGYMLRYHKAVDFIQNFLKEKNVRPASICARYNSAYTSMPKATFWDARSSGGPIVEQGTHFCDLARYLGGEINLDTVSAVFVRPTSPVGKLSEIPPGCDVNLPEEYRIPRATSSHFSFENGAVGILQHALIMKGERYFTEVELWCDGYVVRLVDPYSNDCCVEIFEGANEKQVYHFPDDPYLTEDRVFLEAVQKRDSSKIRSLYSDAVKTYTLSYQIQNGKPKK
jgi:predicted dehydrogenase